MERIASFEFMKITDIISQACIRVGVDALDKTDIITQLVDVLDAAGQITDRESVLQAVLVRERTRSTGIGKGLAVPHGKSQGAPKLAMAIAKPTTPIAFDASDGQPCNIVVLLASPVDEMGPHIQALARISRLWLTDDFRRAVESVASPDEMYAAIQRYQD